MVYCANAKCKCGVRGGLNHFKDHINLKKHAGPFFCFEQQCADGGKSFKVKSSFVRHLETVHPESCLSDDEDESMDSGSSSSLEATIPSRVQEVQDDTDTSMECDGGVASNADEEAEDMEADGSEDGNVQDDFSVQLEKSAALFILNVRRHGNVPGTTVQYIMKETFKLMSSVVNAAEDTISSYLESCDVSQETISKCVSFLSFDDPFKNLRTTEKQMDYFATNFDLVKPEPDGLLIGTVWDDRPDKATGLTLPVQVRRTFQYVSVIKQLTVILNNPILFELIHSEKPSTDGHYRSFLDGSVAKTHPLISKYPNIIRLVKWVDDSEVVNPLGSKTSIHKIVNDLFIVQNLPPEENARLRSIHLSSYSYREDLPEEEKVDVLLAPFFGELEQLESEEGVTIQVNKKPFILRATITGFCADDLEAHELLGLFNPCANRFCTLCLISRHEFHINIFATGPLRSKEMHRTNVEELYSRGKAFALSSSAVKRESILTKKAKYIDFPQAMIKDPMHDILRGIAPMEIKLVLHELCVAKNYFAIEDFNAQLKSFNYGPADIKNKPSPNFTQASLQKPFSYVLHQTAAQAWCLLRVFPFLVRKKFPKVPQKCPHIDLIVLLKRMSDIIFSNEISDNDLLLLENLIHEHHSLFISLYPPALHLAPGEEEVTEEDVNEDFLDENEQEVDDPQPQIPAPAGSQNKKPKKIKVVRPLQKHHHIIHYPDIIRQFGPIVLYWCMRFEAKNALLKRFGAICNNFIRLPLTFANLHQMSHAADFLDLKTAVRDEISFGRGTLKVAAQVPGFNALHELGMQEDSILNQVSEVTVGGFKYIVGLHVKLPIVLNERQLFGQINHIYIFEEQPFLISQDLFTVCYDLDFAAYQIVKPDVSTIRAFKPSILPPIRPMSIWPSADNIPYLSPRNAIGDMLINLPRTDNDDE